MTNQKESKVWDKKEPIPCYHCMRPACAEDGDHHWYCFRCLMELFGDDIDEYESDDTLQVCPRQLEIQSEAFQW